MKRYIITIVNLDNGTVHNLNKDESNFIKTIEKELGEINFDSKKYNGNTITSGISSDGTKLFTIISHESI